MSKFDKYDDLFDEDENEIYDVYDRCCKSSFDRTLEEKVYGHVEPVENEDFYNIKYYENTHSLGLVFRILPDLKFIPFSGTYPNSIGVGEYDAFTINKNEVAEEQWNAIFKKAIDVKDSIALSFLAGFPPRVARETICDGCCLDVELSKDYIYTEIIAEVNKMLLPEELQENNCKTFDDLYKGLNALRFLNEKPSEGYEDGTDALGCYKKDGEKKEICLYIESIIKHYNFDLSDEEKSHLSLSDLLKVVYIHELYHAYFDISENKVLYNVSRYIEEPLAEYATLYTLRDCDYYDVVKRMIERKTETISCRQYGLGASDIGMDIVKKYKYMKYMLEDDDIETYRDCLNGDTFSSERCVQFLKRIFIDYE